MCFGEFLFDDMIGEHFQTILVVFIDEFLAFVFVVGKHDSLENSVWELQFAYFLIAIGLQILHESEL